MVIRAMGEASWIGGCDPRREYKEHRVGLSGVGWDAAG